MAQKSGCRLFGSASVTSEPLASTSRAPPPVPLSTAPVTPVKPTSGNNGGSMLPPSSPPTSPEKIETGKALSLRDSKPTSLTVLYDPTDAEIARLKQELSRSEVFDLFV